MKSVKKTKKKVQKTNKFNEKPLKIKGSFNNALKKIIKEEK